ncbi:hypothetical protein P4475_12625 [Halalkalibacterium halodurans]|uniref:hypothetical protein n=1 Tax=Halalkalibacterium halodurans TaxID=86665 RepID=UPI000A72AD79|nr:hypothetical protein [Halalkalibacterium halodurans]MED3647627.1 hypothetical protein [Halalkalibacterium halodurans]MED4161987.1 hypothetical protein [Halalkalibacterium halodurans]
MVKNFHCCATCVHFEAEKVNNGMVYRCIRLGYETKPAYQFSCWEPKEAVKRLMGKEQA